MKYKHTSSAFLMLIFCFVRDFVAQTDSIKTMAVLTKFLVSTLKTHTTEYPSKKIKKKKKQNRVSLKLFCC